MGWYPQLKPLACALCIGGDIGAQLNCIPAAGAGKEKCGLKPPWLIYVSAVSTAAGSRCLGHVTYHSRGRNRRHCVCGLCGIYHRMQVLALVTLWTVTQSVVSAEFRYGMKSQKITANK